MEATVSKNRDRVRAFLKNETAVESISVEKSMKNNAEPFDVDNALALFRANLDIKYSKK
jgi:hypothetical protein